VGNHRHTPEIEQELSLICGKEVIVSFTPHLAPMKRGMLATICLDLIDTDVTADDIRSVYLDYYKNEPFVRILPLGQLPQTKLVSGSNYIDISINVDTRVKKLVVVSALDNLGKGSASQAIQALNIMAGFDETKGLLTPGQYI
jgi:N-acetyl-gamma-glutamyl-phosphate reductase